MQLYHPKCHARGFSYVDALIALFTVLVLLGFILPWLAKPRHRAFHTRTHCLSNLKQVGLAFRMFANDHFGDFPMAISTNTYGSMEYNENGQVFRHFETLSNELMIPKVLACPSDTNRVKTNYWSGLDNVNVSYFVGLDANETRPQMILAGDRNITGGFSTNGNVRLFTKNLSAGWTKEIHCEVGNLGMADGSVQQVTPQLLRSALQCEMESITNSIIRLAIP